MKEDDYMKCEQIADYVLAIIQANQSEFQELAPASVTSTPYGLLSFMRKVYNHLSLLDLKRSDLPFVKGIVFGKARGRKEAGSEFIGANTQKLLERYHQWVLDRNARNKDARSGSKAKNRLSSRPQSPSPQDLKSKTSNGKPAAQITHPITHNIEITISPSLQPPEKQDKQSSVIPPFEPNQQPSTIKPPPEFKGPQYQEFSALQPLSQSSSQQSRHEVLHEVVQPQPQARNPQQARPQFHDRVNPVGYMFALDPSRFITNFIQEIAVFQQEQPFLRIVIKAAQQFRLGILQHENPLVVIREFLNTITPLQHEHQVLVEMIHDFEQLYQRVAEQQQQERQLIARRFH